MQDLTWQTIHHAIMRRENLNNCLVCIFWFVTEHICTMLDLMYPGYMQSSIARCMFFGIHKIFLQKTPSTKVHPENVIQKMSSRKLHPESFIHKVWCILCNKINTNRVKTYQEELQYFSYFKTYFCVLTSRWNFFRERAEISFFTDMSLNSAKVATTFHVHAENIFLGIFSF